MTAACQRHYVFWGWLTGHSQGDQDPAIIYLQHALFNFLPSLWRRPAAVPFMSITMSMKLFPTVTRISTIKMNITNICTTRKIIRNLTAITMFTSGYPIDTFTGRTSIIGTFIEKLCWNLFSVATRFPECGAKAR